MSKSRFSTQPADDTSEGTVRSNMEIHRCHRLHTEKEERVMLSLVSAYLAWDSSACQMDLPASMLAPQNRKTLNYQKKVTWCMLLLAPDVNEQMLHFTRYIYHQMWISPLNVCSWMQLMKIWMKIFASKKDFNKAYFSINVSQKRLTK